MSTFYIADTHFGHKSVIGLAHRPFSTVEEMNRVLIENWNKKVKNCDTVYVLGDMFFKFQFFEDILKVLKGKKHLIIGNHDTSWIEEYHDRKRDKDCCVPHRGYRLKGTDDDLGKYFLSVSDILQIGDGERSCILCHYPLMTWKHEKRLYMIHGHLHNDTEDSFFHHIAQNEKMLNAGVDINNFEPVTLDELIENNRKFKEAYLEGAI